VAARRAWLDFVPPQRCQERIDRGYSDPQRSATFSFVSWRFSLRARVIVIFGTVGSIGGFWLLDRSMVLGSAVVGS
jgi:hypothetical protein